MFMFCPNCGAENQDDAIFCENCGADVSQAFKEAKAALEEHENAEPVNAEPIIKSPAALEPYIYQKTAGRSVRKPLKKSVKITACVVIAVVAAAVVLYNVGLKMCSPQAVAKNFFGAICSSKWDNAYSYLSVSENDFVNKANFVKETKSLDIPKVLNYSVKSQSDNKNNVPALTGSNEDTQLSKTVTIQYITQNDQTPQTVKIHLIKQGGKKLLFFDEWKVSSSDFVSTNVMINVPKECTAYINNTKISDKYIDKSDTGTSSDNTGNSTYQQDGTQPYTCYKIPSIFSGKYTLKVTSQYTQDYKSEINVNGSNASFDVDNLSLKKSIIEEVAHMSKQAVKDIYAAALAGKSFDSVKSYFDTESDIQNSAESTYNEILNNVANGNTAGFKSITFSNFNSNVTNYSTTGDLSIAVDTQADYSYTYGYPSSSDGKAVHDYTGNNSADITFTFNLCNGKWLISGTNGLVLYHYY